MPINRLSGMFFDISCHRVIVFISSGLRIRHGDGGDEGMKEGMEGERKGHLWGKRKKIVKKTLIVLSVQKESVLLPSVFKNKKKGA